MHFTLRLVGSVIWIYCSNLSNKKPIIRSVFEFFSCLHHLFMYARFYSFHLRWLNGEGHFDNFYVRKIFVLILIFLFRFSSHRLGPLCNKIPALPHPSNLRGRSHPRSSSSVSHRRLNCSPPQLIVFHAFISSSALLPLAGLVRADSIVLHFLIGSSSPKPSLRQVGRRVG